MPVFKYQAKDGPQKLVNGVIEAHGVDHAISKIVALGLAPIDVEEVTAAQPGPSIRGHKAASKTIATKKIRRKDVITFTQQMGDLLEASVPLLRSLQIVSRQTQNQKLKEIIEKMAVFIKDGGSLSDALALYPDIFSSLYVHMTRTGEVGGGLDRALLRLGDYLRKEDETISQIQSSLAYPLLIVCVGVATILVLLTFVIPRVAVMFEDLGQELPLVTVFLMALSRFFADYWWVMLSVVVTIGLGLGQWLRTSNGRRLFDRWKLRIPVLGRYIATVEIERLTRTLGALLEAGVTIIPALNSASATVNNSVLRDEVMLISQKVSQGASFRSALEQSGYFPEIVINMIAMGEETGRLEKGLYKVADTFEKQAAQMSRTIISLLGPSVLIVIVSIVGFVVIALLLPVFQMNLIIQ